MALKHKKQQWSLILNDSNNKNDDKWLIAEQTSPAKHRQMNRNKLIKKNQLFFFNHSWYTISSWSLHTHSNLFFSPFPFTLSIFLISTPPTASLVKWLRRPPQKRKAWCSNPTCDRIFPGPVLPVTSILVLQWLPCQAPGAIGLALGLIGLVSVYCDWVR